MARGKRRRATEGSMARKRRTPSATQQVRRELSELDIDAAGAREVAAAAERIGALGKAAVAALARESLKPGQREAASALLGCLNGEQAAWAADALDKVLNSRRLNAMEHVWLTATVVRLREAALPEGAEPAPGSRRLEGGIGPEPFDPTELMLWREDLADLPSPQRRAMLAPVLQSGDASFLPVLDVALSLGDPSLDAAIAQGLSQFDASEAVALLRELLRRPDATVRRRARESLVALARRGVAACDLFVATPRPDDAMVRAFACDQDPAGILVVAMVGRNANGLYYYAAVVLDPVAAGIREAWGEADLTETRVRDHLGWLADQHGLPLHPIDLNVARALIAAGEDYARQQEVELPVEYAIWRRWIGRPAGQVALPIVFGPSCHACGAPVRADDIERGAFVAGDVALCGDCVQAPQACARCGRTLDLVFDTYTVRHDRDAGGLAFLCMPCEESRREASGHPPP